MSPSSFIAASRRSQTNAASILSALDHPNDADGGFESDDDAFAGNDEARTRADFERFSDKYENRRTEWPSASHTNISVRMGL
jgi:hypothetical protein